MLQSEKGLRIHRKICDELQPIQIRSALETSRTCRIIYSLYGSYVYCVHTFLIKSAQHLFTGHMCKAYTKEIEMNFALKYTKRYL